MGKWAKSISHALLKALICKRFPVYNPLGSPLCAKVAGREAAFADPLGGRCEGPQLLLTGVHIPIL